MNLKKAKAARAILRGMGVNPTDKVYASVKRGGRKQVTLDKDCGRAQYLDLKRSVIRQHPGG